MPAISMFYGIIVRMLFFDTQQHHLPHIHVEYQGQKAVFTIPEGELLVSCKWRTCFSNQTIAIILCFPM